MSDLRILITASLEEKKSIGDINKIIEKIEKSPQLQKIKLSLDIDKNIIKMIQDFNNNYNNIAKSSDKVNNSLNNTTGEINQQTKAIKDATDAEIKWRLEQQKTSRKTGKQTSTYGNGINNNKQTITGNIDGSIRDIVDSTSPLKDLKDQQDLINKMADFREKSEVRVRDEQRKTSALQEDHIQKNADLERTKQEKFNKLLNEAHLMNEKRDKDYYSRKEKMEIKLADIRRRFGSDTNVAEGLNKLESKLSRVGKVGDYKREIDNIDTGLRRVISTADTASSHVMNFGEQLRVAMTRFPVWLVSGTIFMQATHFFTQGIAYVNELDKSLTQIAIVTGKTQEQIAEMAKEYSLLAKEMSVSTQDIAKASVEFYRQGLSQEQVMENVRVATQYAKISNMEFTKSAEVLTATVNSMGIDIERASDVFSYMGDATATGKYMCPIAA